MLHKTEIENAMLIMSTLFVIWPLGEGGRALPLLTVSSVVCVNALSLPRLALLAISEKYIQSSIMHLREVEEQDLHEEALERD